MAMLAALWLPILLSAVLVFVASSVIHMFLGYHATDFGPLPGEDRVMEVMREQGVEPGQYVVPHAEDMEAMSSSEFVEKSKRGPVAMLTVLEPGPPSMGKQLGQWFVYLVMASLLIAYVVSLSLGRGAPYMDVFRVVSATAFLAYVVALWQQPIWYGRTWSMTLKNTLDGLIYALLTAGVFGWLWPGA